jgi:hypothetical protein
MTRLGLAAIAIVGLMSGSVAQGTADMKSVVSAYLMIQDRLAGDTIDGIKGPAKQIVAEASKMGEHGAALLTAGKAVEAAPDLKAARDAFGPLSDAVIAAAKGQDIGEAKVAFCPMVNRSWLQKETTIRNPYYGSSMLTCGEFRQPKK